MKKTSDKHWAFLWAQLADVAQGIYLTKGIQWSSSCQMGPNHVMEARRLAERADRHFEVTRKARCRAIAAHKRMCEAEKIIE